MTFPNPPHDFTWRPVTHPFILVADDDYAVRKLVAATLTADGYVVGSVRNGWEVLDYIGRSLSRSARFPYPSLLILDVNMPGLSGWAVAEGLAQGKSPPALIMMTALADQAAHERARQVGARALLEKPFGLSELREATHAALYAPELATLGARADGERVPEASGEWEVVQAVRSVLTHFPN